AGTNRYADRADDRRGHRAGGGTDRSAYTTALGRAETGMAGTGRSFIITADGVDVMLAVGVEVERRQGVVGKADLSQRRQCGVRLILQLESSRNDGMHERRLRIAVVSSA